MLLRNNSNLHSFGLIIIALLANQFWKTGWVRGLPQVVITCGITYALVRYGLMAWTNFSISSLGYMYEDFAVSILGSPKAYMITITTSLIASRMNLHYGWDFDGILIPSLLALQWSQPMKILTSFVETYFLLITANLILHTPLCQRMTIEGGRKILLFFNISFIYKMLLGYILLWYFPQVKVTDFYGFGYLLPTLMAVKMHDKGIATRLTRATLQTSLAAVLIACIPGFALTHLPARWSPPAAAEATWPTQDAPDSRLLDVIREEKAILYHRRLPDPAALPVPHELDIFAAAVRTVLALTNQPNPRLLQQARTLLAQVNFRLDTIQERYLYLHENAPRHGWGTYVFDLQAPPHGLLVEVPVPIEARSVLEAATQLFITASGRALAIAGTGPRPQGGSAADILRTPQSFFQTFHRILAQHNVLQVRGYNAYSTRVIGGQRRGRTAMELPQLPNRLWVKSTLPPGLDLVRLKELIDDYHIAWATPPLANIQRATTRGGFAELFLNTAGRHKLLFRSLLPRHANALPVQRQRLEGSLQAWLLRDNIPIARSGSNLYIPPKLEDLLLFDAEILTPLVAFIRTRTSSNPWSTTDLEAFRAMVTTVETYGYTLIRYNHPPSAQQYVILAEADTAAEPSRYWGTYVWRLGTAHPYLVQVPRPLLETYTLEHGIALFERIRGRALFISGAHPKANRDGRADMVHPRNDQSLFNLVHQVMLRESDDGAMMVVQGRGLSQRADGPAPSADIFLASDTGTAARHTLSPLGQQLYRSLEQDGFRIRFVDGSAETAGYETTGVLQSRYLKAVRHKELVLLWLSSEARLRYRQPSQNRSQAAQFNALSIPTVEADLHDYVAQQSSWSDADNLPPPLRHHLPYYLDSADIISLRNLLHTWTSYRFERLLDVTSQQAFLLVHHRVEGLALAANLAPKVAEHAIRFAPVQEDSTPLPRFVDGRARWLELDTE